MQRTLFALVVLLLFLAGIVLLQIFLSGRERRWPGLVLPGITFLYSVLALLSVAAMGSVVEMVVAILVVAVLYNIPTLILLAIYFACRGKRRKRGELNRMKIEDL